MRIIFKTKFGSHLYGTNTPDSDEDHKAIFMESLENIILSKDRHTVNETTKKGNTFGVRNTKDDVECEYIELRRFIKDAMSGQTYALDMLFAPKEFWIDYSDIWERIIENRHEFLSKDVAPLLGYCRQQAGKYGLRGSRLADLLRVIEHLKKFDTKALLKDCLEGFEPSEFATIYEIVVDKPHQEEPMKQTFLDVLGKKFSISTQIHNVLFSLEKMNAVYGDRAKKAMENEGVDFKAVSHAFRCCYQLLELAETCHITFPLKNAEYIRDIKQGKIPYVDLGDHLYALMENSKAAIEDSDLPENPNREFWESFILKTYL